MRSEQRTGEGKASFLAALRGLTDTLGEAIGTPDGQWTVKGFIDVYRSIYTISADTKIISKILEIHLFPKLLSFAEKLGFGMVLADHQNYYPDISFVKADNPGLKFAVDIKTTYRQDAYPGFCNGFTLGSHGEYFIDRNSTKNIQFPYNEYAGHFCLGIIYSRHAERTIDETRTYRIEDLQSIASVIRDVRFFVQENGGSLVTGKGAVIRPTSAASTGSTISSRATGCSRPSEKTGSMTIG